MQYVGKAECEVVGTAITTTPKKKKKKGKQLYTEKITRR